MHPVTVSPRIFSQKIITCKQHGHHSGVRGRELGHGFTCVPVAHLKSAFLLLPLRSVLTIVPTAQVSHLGVRQDPELTGFKKLKKKEVSVGYMPNKPGRPWARGEMQVVDLLLLIRA